VHPESSSYTIDLPAGRGDFPTYYAAELKLHVANDATLFPTLEHSWPGPILTPDGLEEHEIDHIIDSHMHGHGFQYLIRWKGYGPEDNKWLPGCLLKNCEALNRWYESVGDGPGSA
jgi:Chromo (CHRromatin Organisation MOdifier) domain